MSPSINSDSGSGLIGADTRCGGAEVVRRLHEHRFWSSARICQAAGSLSDEALNTHFDIGMGTIFESLAHIWMAEWVWLSALEGQIAARLPHEGKFRDLDQLLKEWGDLDRRWRVFLANLEDSGLNRPVTRTNTAGETHTTSALDVLLHVCDHAAYTTAQMINMMRHIGVSPLPARGLINFAREQGVKAPQVQ